MRMAAVMAGTYNFPDSAGGAVTVNAALTVNVAGITAASVTINGAKAATNYVAGTVTAGVASSTLDRIDTVYYDGTATIGIAAGTPVLTSATLFPTPPTLAAGQIAVANLYVAKTATAFVAGDIDDRRSAAKAIVTKGTDIASGAALALPNSGQYFDVTGTTTITSIESRPAGFVLILQFDGALTLTHNATSLILRGGANVTTAAGDVFTFVSEGSGNWREVGRLTATSIGAFALAGSNTTEATTTSTGDLVTVSGLSIPATTPFMVTFNYRKAAGAVASVLFGIKLNTTQMYSASSGQTAAETGTADEAQSGYAVARFGARRTNYLRGGPSTWAYQGAGQGSSGTGRAGAADAPTATITSIVITVGANASSLTAGVQDVYVWTLA